MFKSSARINRDIKARQEYKALELHRSLLKSITLDQTVSYASRLEASVELGHLGKKGSRTVLTNRCVLTGRSKGVHKTYRISRIMLKKLALEGRLPNVHKHSW